jgi:NAD(P)-dependent dehydrogenase (short-subunit alcohol dehydrogenase family)
VWQTVMDIDAVGVFNMSTAAFPALRDSGERTVNSGPHVLAGGRMQGMTWRRGSVE